MIRIAKPATRNCIAHVNVAAPWLMVVMAVLASASVPAAAADTPTRAAPTAEEISLRTLDNQWVEVSYGKSNFKLMGIDPEEYPGMPQAGTNGTKTVSFEIDAGDLNEMVRKTIFAVSSDDTRSNLAGVYLTTAKKIFLTKNDFFP